MINEKANEMQKQKKYRHASLPTYYKYSTPLTPAYHPHEEALYGTYMSETQKFLKRIDIENNQHKLWKGPLYG